MELEAKVKKHDNIALIAAEFARAKNAHGAAYEKFSSAIITHGAKIEE